MHVLRMTREFLATPPSGWRVSDAIVDEGGEVRAWVSAMDPLRDAAPAGHAGGALVLLSGGAGRVMDASGATEAEAELVRPAWMPGSRDRFGAFARDLALRGGEYWFWPRCDHALSDVPSVQTFLRAHPGFGLLFDPVALLAASMLERAEEHLARLFESLGSHECTRAIVLANIAPGSEIEGVRASPLHRGVVRPRLLVELWREHCGAETPVVLLDEELTEQRQVLECV